MRLHATIISLILCASGLLWGAAWERWLYYPGYTSAPAPASTNALATFTFPPASDHQLYPAFLVLTQGTTMNLTGATVRAEFSVLASPDATFRFGGQGTWNTGTLPAATRLYFSTVTSYYNEGPATNYWFHSASWVALTNALAGGTLAFTFTNAAGWSDGQGGTNPEAFWFAASRARTVGLCFGGGSFYDIGIAALTGTAEFQLRSFECSPSFRIDRDGTIAGGWAGNEYVTVFADGLIAPDWSTNPPLGPVIFARGMQR